MKIAIITNFNIIDKANAALKVAEELLRYEATVLFLTMNKDRIFRMHKNKKEYVYLSPEEIYGEADLVLVLGGDGSMLDAARRVSPLGKPLLGVNMGHLGYMTELEIQDVDKLSRLFTGEYEIDERMMLSASVETEQGVVRGETFALNDFVISNGSVSRVLDLELSVDKEAVVSYRADGLIVATPTGSTAYSMSAGGAITDPRLDCFCVTPICSHLLSARPLIFSGDAVIEVKNTCSREKMLCLTADGRTGIDIYRGDVVRVTRSPMKTRLVRLGNGGFYEKLRKIMV